MEGRLLIKHAVGGRTFLDSAKTPVPFVVRERTEGGWSFEVQVPSGPAIAELLKWKRELNLFVFEEQLQPVVKHWFYVEPDRVMYDEASGTLRLAAGSKLDYVPDEYTW
ncbi:hypothetical protein [Paenibacillus sp.]|uniref:hypothetical protein n=1 Tax=Paenibacillus sp. TaxID=58172 RepID=UPI002D5B2C16|nr:hypothetical protein [Paenibacillus sp.]HZG58567.1 hypothetical protein [Paenibacillus sp.]